VKVRETEVRSHSALSRSRPKGRAVLAVALLLMLAALPTRAHAQAFDAVGDVALYENDSTYYALTPSFPGGWRLLLSFQSQSLDDVFDTGVGQELAVIASPTSAISFNALLNAWGAPQGGTAIGDLAVGDTVAVFLDDQTYAGYSVAADSWATVGPTGETIDTADARGDLAIITRASSLAGFSNQGGSWASTANPGSVSIDLGKVVGAAWNATDLRAYDAATGSWSSLTTTDLDVAAGESLLSFADSSAQFGAFAPLTAPGFNTLAAGSTPTLLSANPDSRVALYQGSHVGYSSTSNTFTTPLDLGGTVNTWTGKKVGLMRAGNVSYGLSDSIGGDFTSWLTLSTASTAVGDRVALVVGTFGAEAFSSRTGEWAAIIYEEGETVATSGAGGDIAVVATDDGLYMFNAITGAWTRYDEAGVTTLDIGTDVAIMSTGLRLYGFSASKDVLEMWPVASVAEIQAKGNTAVARAPEQLAAFSRWTGVWSSIPIVGPTDMVTGDNLAMGWSASEAVAFNSYLGTWHTSGLAGIEAGAAGRSVGLVRTASTARGFSVVGAPRAVELETPLPRSTTPYGTPLVFDWDGDGYTTFQIVFAARPLAGGVGASVAFDVGTAETFSPDAAQWQQVLGVVAESHVGHPIFWTVIGEDAAHSPDYADWWPLFVTGMDPPVPTAPDGTAEDDDMPPFFTWAPGDYNFLYRVEISMGPGFTPGPDTLFLTDWIPDLTYQPLDAQWATLVALGSQGDAIFWRVWGREVDRPDRASSVVLSFRIDFDPPDPQAPDGTEEDRSMPAFFTWLAGDYALFRVELSNSPLFEPGPGTFFLSPWIPDVMYQPLNDEWADVVALGAWGNPLYWRVWGRAPDKADRPSDDVLSFTIALPSGWTLLTTTYASALGGKDPELYVFRDHYLKSLPGGKAAVDGFYANLPWIAQLAARDPVARSLGSLVVAPSAALAQYIVGSDPANDAIQTKAGRIRRARAPAKTSSPRTWRRR